MADTKKNIDEAADKAKSATDKTANAAKAATDTMREAGDKARAGFNDRVVEPAKRAGEAVKASGKKVAEGGSTISARLIDQAETNAKQAFAAMREAAKANDISEVMRVQGDYMRNQAQRSVEQAREIGELIVQFGKEAVTPLKGDAKK
ncbi:MAG: phasin family protein [Pseudomonadota bacterium]|nr:phasin family protein [Pseudomonadota bacterium]